MQIASLMESSGVAFGTSGARGTVEAMTNTVCHAYTMGFLQAMAGEGSIKAGSTVVLAGDLRPSTGRILAAVARAVRDAGYQVTYAGRLPSPAVAFYAMQRGAASIMVTGSHIPDDRNGIKFNRPDGEILKGDEARIREQEVELREPPSDIDASDLPPEEPAARRAYIERYLGFFPPACLQGLHIGVYEHSGVARDLLGDILEGLGAKVTRLARSDVFVPVDTEAIRTEDVELGEQWANEHAFDAIVSTDGDADRPLIADERGRWLRGDIVGILCAYFLGIDTVVTPVSSNTAVEACGWFRRVHRTRIGSPYVIERMNQALAEGGTVAGYEANGGFLLASDVSRGGRTLAALPTRDAVLPMLAILAAAVEQGSPVSALVAALPQRFTASGRLKDFPTEESRIRIRGLTDNPALIEAQFGHLCGKVRHTDSTDGLRITFENDEIVHLRPSGNAPELRCYNEADSPQRAEELNRDCLEMLARWR
ncbi:MAG: phosphomannomutase [Gammaproteobacteria bacterium]